MSSKFMAVTASLAPVLGLGACHSPPAQVSPSPLTLEVDSAVYHRRGQSPVAVAYAITNHGEAPLYLAQCNGSPMAVVDRWLEGNWRFLEGGFCNGAAPSPLELRPGDSVGGIVIIYDGGAYRLRVNATPAQDRTSEGATTAKEFDVW